VRAEPHPVQEPKARTTRPSRPGAEDALKQAKAGADFAALAKKILGRRSNAPNGGDLDFFGKGRMVPEFDTAAFRDGTRTDQRPREDRVRLSHHQVDRQGNPEVTRKIDEVRKELTDRLAAERAQVQATTLAETLEPQIKKPADSRNGREGSGLTVQETGSSRRTSRSSLSLGARDERPARLPQPGRGVRSPFASAGHRVRKRWSIRRTSTFRSSTRRKTASAKPSWDSVRAMWQNRRRTKLAAKVKSAPDFDKAVKAAGAESQGPDWLTRDAPRPDVGASAE